MKRSISPHQARTRASRSKTNAQGFYFNPKTQKRSATKESGFEYWDSELEFSIALQLQIHRFRFERQKKVLVLPEILGFPKREWKVDFYLPEIHKYLEVKGSWINNASMKGELREFRLLLHSLAFNSPTTFSNVLIVAQEEIRGIETISRNELIPTLEKFRLCLG
jgi:hypothetical protein